MRTDCRENFGGIPGQSVRHRSPRPPVGSGPSAIESRSLGLLTRALVAIRIALIVLLSPGRIVAFRPALARRLSGFRRTPRVLVWPWRLVGIWDAALWLPLRILA